MDMNKLPPGVREALRKRGREEAEVAIMTPREVFEDYCNWNGLINWSDTLWNTMEALVQAQPAPAKCPPGAECSVDEMGFMQITYAGEPKKVVVVLTGGIVDQVLVGEEGVSVAVIDYDKNADLDDLVVIPQTDGTNQYALTGIHEPEVNPVRADELYAAVEEAKPAAEDENSSRPRP